MDKIDKEMKTALQERVYRGSVSPRGLFTFSIREKETDVLVSASADIREKAVSSILRRRRQVEEYAAKDRTFLHSLHPVHADRRAPDIVKDMCSSSRAAGVGPMACVAGAIAQYAGLELLDDADEIIIENGGDIFLKSDTCRTVGIYAGDSVFSGALRLEAACGNVPLGICTSSGTVGHSLNFGCADAVVVCSHSAVLADAVATASSNMVKKEDDIERAIDFARALEGVRGIIVIMKDKLGAWGDIKLSPSRDNCPKGLRRAEFPAEIPVTP